jgi:hypothetical protein
MSAMALLSFDFFNPSSKSSISSSLSSSESSSSFHRKREKLIKIHQLLVDNYYHNFTAAVFTNEELSQLILYFEFLQLLPENIKDNLLKDRPIPTFILPSSDPLPKTESQSLQIQAFSQILMEELQQTTKTTNKSLDIETNFPVLKSGIYPVDIAIVEEREGESEDKENFKKVFGLIDVSEEKHENDKSVSRSSQLKELLYEHYYPNIPYQIIHFNNNEVKDETSLRKTIRKALKKLIK